VISRLEASDPCAKVEFEPQRLSEESAHEPESRYPFSDRLKLHTPEFVQQLKETGQTVVLTINGKAELVVLDAASYERLFDLAEAAGVLEGIRSGLKDVQAGRTQSLAEAFSEIRRKLKLPAR
jgi:PHD/YefM family antitoxin component YafN of YafNO toxin-antitoxin module